MGFSIYPDTKMDEQRVVAIMQRIRDRPHDRQLRRRLGPSDPLKTAKTGLAMLDAGIHRGRRRRVLWRNPVEFYGQSGRLELDPVPGFAPREPRAPATFEGNSVLRGARPGA